MYVCIYSGPEWACFSVVQVGAMNHKPWWLVNLGARSRTRARARLYQMPYVVQRLTGKDRWKGALGNINTVI